MDEKNLNWEIVLKDDICKIERRFELNNQIPILRTTAFIEGFSSKEIFEAISNIPLRKIWDRSFSELAIVEHNIEENYDILYMVIKVYNKI